MTSEEKTTLKEHGMTDEEIKLINCPISMIPKGFLSKALAARQHQIEIIEKMNEEWDKTHPRKSYLSEASSSGAPESEDCIGLDAEEQKGPSMDNFVIRVDGGNTPSPKPKYGEY